MFHKILNFKLTITEAFPKLLTLQFKKYIYRTSEKDLTSP